MRLPQNRYIIPLDRLPPARQQKRTLKRLSLKDQAGGWGGMMDQYTVDIEGLAETILRLLHDETVTDGVTGTRISAASFSSSLSAMKAAGVKRLSTALRDRQPAE